MRRMVIGIDEVGRGPLAGPVAVCAVACAGALAPMKDSKALSPCQREKIFRACAFPYKVSFVSEKVIDRIGIVPAVSLAVSRALSRLNWVKSDFTQCRILLDGGLRAPRRFLNQKTIIRGDETEPIIALASIIAKVRRDRRMTRLSKKYPDYGFEKHKGYGTRAHYAALKKFGLSPIHRRSFCKSLSEKEVAEKMPL